MSVRIEWDIPPIRLADATLVYGDRLIRAVEAAARRVGPLLEARAKQDAAWTDRTGNARQGLSHTVDVAQNLVTIYLFHRMSYGVFLELARGGRLAVIMPTIESALPDVFRELQAIFR